MKRRIGLVTALFLLLASLACNFSPSTEVTPTATNLAVSESTAEATATGTPAVSPTANQATASPTQPADIAAAATATNTTAPAEQQPDCGFEADFIADLNIPDGTIFEPNTNFNKSWRLKNTGCALWPAGMEVFFVSGHQTGGPSAAGLPLAVEPGAEVDITLAFKAPATGGSYQANYQLRDTNGVPFGPIFYVSIIVPEQGGGSNSGGSNSGGGGQGPGDVQANPTVTPTPTFPVIVILPTSTLGIIIAPVCTYNFTIVEHITPNGQTLFTGQYFEKKWRMQNTGTCKFPNGSQFYFISGDQLSAPTFGSLTVSQLVSPNQTFVFTLTGYGPQGDGLHSGSWGFRDNNGKKFGPTFTMEVNVE